MKLLLVDDDRMVAESLEIIFSSEPDIQVVAGLESGEDAVEYVRSHAIDMVLMDIRMGGMDGIEATRIIHREFPKVKIIMLTTFHDYDSIHRSLHAGASGYILKSDETHKQLMTIRSVHAGLPVISEEALKSYSEPVFTELLSKRENEILSLVANGLSNKEIASRLYLSEGTVRNTISIILDTLQVRDRTQLAIRYWQWKEKRK